MLREDKHESVFFLERPPGTAAAAVGAVAAASFAADDLRPKALSGDSLRLLTTSTSQERGSFLFPSVRADVAPPPASDPDLRRTSGEGHLIVEVSPEIGGEEHRVGSRAQVRNLRYLNQSSLASMGEDKLEGDIDARQERQLLHHEDADDATLEAFLSVHHGDAHVTGGPMTAALDDPAPEPTINVRAASSVSSDRRPSKASGSAGGSPFASAVEEAAGVIAAADGNAATVPRQESFAEHLSQGEGGLLPSPRSEPQRFSRHQGVVIQGLSSAVPGSVPLPPMIPRGSTMTSKIGGATPPRSRRTSVSGVGNSVHQPLMPPHPSAAPGGGAGLGGGGTGEEGGDDLALMQMLPDSGFSTGHAVRRHHRSIHIRMVRHMRTLEAKPCNRISLFQ